MYLLEAPSPILDEPRIIEGFGNQIISLDRAILSLRTSVQLASTAFCETLLPEGLNIRMQFFIASASTGFCETLKIDFDYSQS